MAWGYLTCAPSGPRQVLLRFPERRGLIHLERGLQNRFNSAGRHKRHLHGESFHRVHQLLRVREQVLVPGNMERTPRLSTRPPMTIGSIFPRVRSFPGFDLSNDCGVAALSSSVSSQRRRLRKTAGELDAPRRKER
jgi:hypothetical protein